MAATEFTAAQLDAAAAAADRSAASLARARTEARAYANALSHIKSFNIDIDDAGLQKMVGGLKTLKADMKDIGKLDFGDERLQKVFNLMKQMNKIGILKDGKSKRAVKDLTDGMRRLGLTQADISKMTQKDLVSYDQLSKLQKLKVFWANQEYTTRKKYVDLKTGREYAFDEKHTSALKKAASVTQSMYGVGKKVTRYTVGYAQSLTGIQLSLTGLISLLIDYMNIQNRIGAMSRQTAYQWKASNTGASTATRTMTMLMGQFKMSVDEAGALTGSLARAGIEQDNIYNLARNTAAFEKMTGVSVDEQVGYAKDLAKSYGMSSTEAWGMYRGILESTKEIPNMSMSEIASDMGNIVATTRDYNTDLLTTMGLYTTLMSKADKIGLGDTSVEMRRGLVNAAAGFNETLSDGVKAWVGGLPDAVASINLFEDMNPGEQLAAVLKKVKESGDDLFKYRKLIGALFNNMGLKQMQVKELSTKVYSGELSPEKLSEETTAAVDKMRADQASEESGRKKMYTSAASIAANLMGFEEKLKQAIGFALTTAKFGDLRIAMNKIANEILINVPKFIDWILSIANDISAFFGAKKRQPLMLDQEQEARQADLGFEQSLNESMHTRFAQNAHWGASNQSYLSTAPAMHGAVMQQLGGNYEDLLTPEVLNQYQSQYGTLPRRNQAKFLVSAALSRIGRTDQYTGDRQEQEFAEIEEFIRIRESGNRKELAGFLAGQLIRERAEIERSRQNYVQNYNSRGTAPVRHVTHVSSVKTFQ